MSGLEAGHVQKMPLKSDLQAGYAWLTQKKAERLDMSSLRAGHVRGMPLESGLGAGYVLLTREKVERPNISVLGGGADMSGQSL
jgi:hypothetical protein